MNRLDAIWIRFQTHPTTYNSLAAPRHLAEVVDIDDIGALLAVAEAAANYFQHEDQLRAEIAITWNLLEQKKAQDALRIALAPLLEEVER